MAQAFQFSAILFLLVQAPAFSQPNIYCPPERNSVFQATAPIFQAAYQFDSQLRLLTGQVGPADAEAVGTFLSFLEKVSREDILRELEARNIKVAEDNIPESLLKYLYIFFEETRFQSGKLITIRLSSERGPIFVKRVGDVLEFTLDADQNLFTKNLSEEFQKIKPSLAQLDPSIPLELKLLVNYNNTFFEQLSEALLSHGQIRFHIENAFGFKVDDEKNKYTRPFTKAELLSLHKVLADLPVDITKTMALKRIVRWLPGDEDAAADYDFKTETIRIFDDTFANGKVAGEGTLIHELGHALWKKLPEDLKKEFSSISWETVDADYSKKSTKIPGLAEFVTEYSATTPTEDFAEHFSFYMNHPELLESKSPQKFDFFKNKIYKGSSYYSQSGDRTKIYIESKRPDTQPPYFFNPEMSKRDDVLARAIALSVKNCESDTNSFELNCKLGPIFDRVSGLKKFVLQLESPMGGSTDLYIRFDEDDFKLGTNSIYTKVVAVPRDRYLAGNYKASWSHLSDRAGNEVFLSTTGIPRLSIPGTKQIATKAKHPKPNLDDPEFQRNIKISNVPLSELGLDPKDVSKFEPVYRVELPVQHPEDLRDTDLNWMDEKTSESFSQWVRGENAYRSKPGDPKIIFDISFPKEFPQTRVRLAKVTINFAESQSYQAGYTESYLDRNLKNLGVDISPSEPDVTHPSADVNKLELGVTYNEANKRGGDTSIDLVVPVDGFDKNEYAYASVHVRSPSGKMIYERLHLKNSRENPLKEFKVKIPLLPNPEAGVYILDELSVTEIVSSNDGSSVPPGVNLPNPIHREASFKFVERGIRREITVKPKSEPTNIRLE